MGRDLDALQGSWHIASIEMDGRKMPGGGATIVIDGKRFTTTAMGASYAGKVTFYETTSPRSFDLHFEEGPEKGNTNLGIYQLAGDTWNICLATRGAERPREFVAPPGTGIALETLERRAPAVQPAATPAAADASVSLTGGPAAELAGDWTSVSLVRDGQALPASMLKHGRRIATANHVTVKFGPTVMLEAAYAVNRSVSPMTMDYLLAGGERQYGIWALENRQLTTCFGAPGLPRPSEFASAAGDGRTLAVWTPAAS
jgi:uncharacterized protein (TIGR03067 family)